MNVEKRRDRIIFYLVIFLYKCTLDLIYVLYVAPKYSYAGYRQEFHLYKYLISLVLLMVLLQPVVMLFKRISASKLFMIVFSLVYFIPGLTLYGFAGVADDYFVFFSSYWLLLIFFTYYFPRFKITFPDSRMGKIIFFTILLFLAATGLYISGYFNGFRFHFGLMDVYELRSFQSKVDVPVLLRYLQPQISIILPIALAYFLIHRMRFWATLVVIVQLLLFGFGGHKTTLFSLFIVFIVYFFYSEKKTVWIIFGALGLNLMVFLEALLSGGFSYINTFIQYRTLFMPGMISSQYFDFFSSHELVLLRDSLLRWVGFKNPYGMPIPTLISGEYTGNYEIWANNGLCGDAFYQFGWFGLILYPLLIVFAIRFLEACTRNLDIRIVFTACILFALTFINCSFFIVMLTNGFILTCVVFFFLPRDNRAPETDGTKGAI